MYSMRFQEETTDQHVPPVAYDVKRTKGVPTRFVNKNINHERYLEMLFADQGVYQRDSIVSIRPRAHVLHTEQNTRITLSQFYDKRFILDDAIRTVPFGYNPL